MNSLLTWLDHRTGYRKLLHEGLMENVPGGARWRYVWGSTLTFAIAVQFITGIFLWMGYSPNAHGAWESVFYIQHQMPGGWLLRGIHHYCAQLMPVLLVLHLLQVVIDGAYKAPREINYWFGLLLLLLVFGLSLTGYLLPWDQKGYWATNVATSILGQTPLVGAALQKIVLGGTEYGHLTLTRFFALHAGVLPATLVALIIGHIYLFRRHGIHAKTPFKKPDAAFWPDQVLKDAIACFAVLAAILFLVVRHRLFDASAPLGADLGAPADPSEPFDAARPDWYFLFLFEFLKYFPGQWEILGAIVIPTLVLLLLFALPLLGKWHIEKAPVGHYLSVITCFILLFGAAALTQIAMRKDRDNPAYGEAVLQAEKQAQRVKELALLQGIPESGAVSLLRNDPLTQGPRLFAQHCASCHRYEEHDGLGNRPKDPVSAPDLANFASRDWIAGLLDPDKIISKHYFGNTKFVDGKMARWVKRNLSELDDEEKENLQKAIAALSAQAKLPYQNEIDSQDQALIQEGNELIVDEFSCIDCHAFLEPDEDATAPDLTGYGSVEWLERFLHDPAHPTLYGERNDRMPSFGKEAFLTSREIQLLIQWLRRDWPTLPLASHP